MCEGHGLLREVMKAADSLPRKTHTHTKADVYCQTIRRSPWNTSMDLVLNKCCYTFLISAQFHFSFYRLSCGILNLKAFFKGCWRLGSVTSLTTYQHMKWVGVSEQAWLLEHWDQCCLSLPLVSFSGACLFKATCVYLREANETQTYDQILWHLKAWLNILLWIAPTVSKGSKRAHSSNLQTWTHFISVQWIACHNLKSQMNKWKQA